jgi:hypothetical protein
MDALLFENGAALLKMFLEITVLNNTVVIAQSTIQKPSEEFIRGLSITSDTFLPVLADQVYFGRDRLTFSHEQLRM